jgi:hypothetical protein
MSEIVDVYWFCVYLIISNIFSELQILFEILYRTAAYPCSFVTAYRLFSKVFRLCLNTLSPTGYSCVRVVLEHMATTFDTFSFDTFFSRRLVTIVYRLGWYVSIFYISHLL